MYPCWSSKWEFRVGESLILAVNNYAGQRSWYYHVKAPIPRLSVRFHAKMRCMTRQDVIRYHWGRLFVLIKTGYSMFEVLGLPVYVPKFSIPGSADRAPSSLTTSIEAFLYLKLACHIVQNKYHLTMTMAFQRDFALRSYVQYGVCFVHRCTIYSNGLYIRTTEILLYQRQCWYVATKTAAHKDAESLELYLLAQ